VDAIAKKSGSIHDLGGATKIYSSYNMLGVCDGFQQECNSLTRK
jgi:hypothetical protein